MSSKVFIIACEPSGDSHGAHLVTELKRLRPGTEFRGLGGPKMAAAGVSLLHDMTALSALGFGDVLRQYFKYRKIFYQALKDVRQFKPNVIVVIDSPAFNLRFAKKINKEFPLIYYISPQIWAWAWRRIKVIKKYVTKLLVIFPFEKEMYNRESVPCEFVGHPLMDQIPEKFDRETIRRKFQIKPDQRAIGLLAGSREKEVKRILPLMFECAKQIKAKIPNAVFFVTQSPSVPAGLYEPNRQRVGDLSIHRFSPKNPGEMYELVAALDFALITSGTATLEAALIGTPYFLLYKTGWTTYWLGRTLIKVPYLGIVNILSQKGVVPEFIQQDIRPANIADQAATFLSDKAAYEKMKSEFRGVLALLGQTGASRSAALQIANYM